MKKKIFKKWFFLFIFSPKILFSQFQICFHNQFLNSELILDKKYALSNDSISISSLNYYVSKISIFNDSNLIYEDRKLGHLISHEINQSPCIKLECDQKIKFNRISFNLGIDSVTHIKGVLGGDLDPTKGMYWTWNSGYINFKIEGYSSRSSGKNHLFQFHIGGYQFPFNSCQKIDFTLKRNSTIDIYFDVFNVLNGINLQENHQIMRPCKSAVEIANMSKNAFYIE